MPATLLLDCLKALGSTGTRQIEYIETFYGHDDYLNKVCKAIHPSFAYDKYRTEAQSDACSSNRGAYMYPSNTKQGWLGEGYRNRCGNKNYIGFYCKGNNNQ